MDNWIAKSGGYRWWYFDALSNDGESALVAIFFVGSVFSPHYAKRLRRGEDPSPYDHCAINVGLYRRGRKPWWVFSEYGANRFEGEPGAIGIASSYFETDANGAIDITIEDVRVATRQRTSGHIRMIPLEGPLTPAYLDLGRGHEWRAHAPRMMVEAKFSAPAQSFVGLGYHDENRGPEPLSKAFSSWSWGRHHVGDGSRVFFDLALRGERSREGTREHRLIQSGVPEVRRTLPPRKWAKRLSHWMAPIPKVYDGGLSLAGDPIALVPVWELERAPFYSRFVSALGVAPNAVRGMSEHISFDRFESRVVKEMIALRLARPDENAYGWIS